MNVSLFVTFAGLFAALTFGVADFLAAKSTKKYGSLIASTVINTLGAVVYVIFFTIFLRHHLALTWPSFIDASIAGSFFSFGLFAFYKGLKIGPVSLVSPVASVYPLVTTTIAIIIFHSHLNIRQSMGILLVVAGVTATSGLLASVEGRGKITKGIKFAIIAAATWGVGFASLAHAIKLSNWQSATLVDFIVSSLVLIFLIIVLRKGNNIVMSNIISSTKNANIWMTTIIQLLGYIVFCIGISKSTSNGGAVITAISSCYPILTIWLALKHFKEKIKAIPLIGALVGIFGIVVLSI